MEEKRLSWYERLVIWICNFFDDLTDNLIILVFVVIFLTGVYFVADSTYVFLDASLDLIRARQAEVDSVEEVLGELTEDAVAWISIDGTSIDYPIMHCDNNEKYLNLNPYGEYSLAGSIFLDFRNYGDFSDPYMLLYGHHMTHGYMFGALDQFENEEFFNTHTRGVLTYNGREYELYIFAFAVFDAMDEHIFDPTFDPEGTREYIEDRIIYHRTPTGYPILALSTCRDPGDTSRTLVFTEVIGMGDTELERLDADRGAENAS